jgi:3-hydroxy-9,10-secoandrosta-1,3,5(10)-triene-9,17-dione monooxygenase
MRRIAMESQQFQQIIEKLSPGIAERAGRCDQERCVPEESVKELIESGVLRAFQPSRFGGLEVEPIDFYEGTSRIAEGCPSTAWVTGVLGVHSWQLALFPDEAQQEVWGDDPTVLISSSYAPTGKVEVVDGGYRISGRWGFSSGCQHAKWVFLGGVVPGGPKTWGGLPDIRTFLLPIGDYQIEDTWHTVGMVGTGSHDIVVDGAFVPEHRTLPFANLVTNECEGWEVNDAPLFRTPFAAIFVNCLAAPAIGNARSALSRYVSRCRDKVEAARERGKDPLDPPAQVIVAESAADLDGATLQRRHNLIEMMDYARRNEEIPVDRRARYRWDAGRAACVSAEVCNRLFDAGGGHGIYLSDPSQRAFRDARVMAVHAYTHRDKSARVYGRAALGYDFKDYLL